MDSPFLTIEETVELTGLSRVHLAQLRHRGDGPPFYNITPKRVRYDRSEVLEWMKSKRRHRTDETPAAAR